MTSTFHGLRLAIFLGLYAMGGAAHAAPSVPTTCAAGCVHFSGSGTSDSGGSSVLSSEVFFQQFSSNLVVTLVNTGLEAVQIPSDILTGVYFTLMDGASLVTLNPLTAYVADRPEVDFPDTADARLVNSDNTTYNAADQTNATGIQVGAEFAYYGASNFDFHGAKSGISSSGVKGEFGEGNFCNGGKFGDEACENIAGPNAVDGMQLGLVPFSGFSSSLADGIGNHNPYTQSSVQFTLAGLPTGFNLTSGSLSNVGFQYGTSITQPNFDAGTPPTLVSTPTTLALLGLGSLLLVAFNRRRTR